jgi:uncharacterized protein YbjT (DUF2867 family)
MPQPNGQLNVVTGAFGFSGKYIAHRLLATGQRVRTLTTHPGHTPGIEVAPLDFRNPQQLADSMAGATALYNTYWVRFAYGETSHEKAAENTRLLIRAAEQAGVRRIVHVSITNPSPDSPLPYFKGKAAVEEIIRSSSLSYAILRPAVLFGTEDILINNIAWLLRRFPLFAIPGSGDYGLQPIFVDDFAALAVDSGQHGYNMVTDAVGPETYQYKDLVQLVRTNVNSSSRIFHAPPAAVRCAACLLGLFVRDVLLTRDEVRGLMANLLVSEQPSSGSTSLRDWLRGNAKTIGTRYASEVKRHYRGNTPALDAQIS